MNSKALWTILFVAIAAAAGLIATLLVPEASRSGKFWLSLGGLGLSLAATFIAFTSRSASAGEQGGAVARGSLMFASVSYFLGAIVLAAIAATGIAFKWLATLHILALLMWVVVVCLGGIGSNALAHADRK